MGAQRVSAAEPTVNALTSGSGTTTTLASGQQLTVSIPVSAQFHGAIQNAIKIGAASMQMLKLVEKKHQRS